MSDIKCGRYYILQATTYSVDCDSNLTYPD